MSLEFIVLQEVLLHGISEITGPVRDKHEGSGSEGLNARYDAVPSIRSSFL